ANPGEQLRQLEILNVAGRRGFTDVAAVRAALGGLIPVMAGVRLTVAFAVIGCLAGEVMAAQPPGPIPLPRPRPALKADNLASLSAHNTVGKSAVTPFALAPQPLQGGITAAVPHVSGLRQATYEPVNSSASRPPGASR